MAWSALKNLILPQIPANNVCQGLNLEDFLAFLRKWTEKKTDMQPNLDLIIKNNILTMANQQPRT